MSFPAVTVELQIDGSWVDVTSDVLTRDDIVITRGRAEAAQHTERGTCTFTLNNRGGKYSPRNPRSPYYGLIGRNTPVRVKAEGVTRFVGEISEWPTRWDVSGRDVYVPIEASGILRRLSQGVRPLKSALFRYMTSLPEYPGYWPLEDSPGSRQAASGYPEGAPMAAAGQVSFTGESVEGIGGGVSVSKGGRLYASVAAPAIWFVACWIHLPQDMGPGDSSPVVSCICPTSDILRRWDFRFYVDSSNVLQGEVVVFDRTGAPVTVQSSPFSGSADLRRRGVQRVIFYGKTWSGTQYSCELDLEGGEDLFEVFDAGVADQLKDIGRVEIAGSAAGDPNYVGTISHLVVGPASMDNAVLDADDAGHGFAGELAVDRVTRLCAEEGIPVVVTDDPDIPSKPMGAQAQKALLDLLRDVEAVDGGVLGEQRDGVGLWYRSGATLYGDTPDLTLSYGQTMSPIEPIDDDSHVRNDNTVRREGGSSARIVKYDGPLSINPPPDGVGLYAEETTLNLYQDRDALDQAGWRTHLGTWDEARYPTVGVMLHKNRDLVAAATAVDGGAHVRLTDMPEWLPPGPVDLLVYGYTETIAPHRWEIVFNAVPQGPYQIATLDDEVLGRLDTDGSGLAAPLTETATTLVTSAAGGPPWTEDPAEFPFDLLVGRDKGGEVVRATAATKGCFDTFDRTAVDGWGTSPEGLKWTMRGGAAADYSVSGGVAQHVIGTRGTDRESRLEQYAAGHDIEATFRTTALPTGAPLMFYLVSHFNLSEFRWYALRISLNVPGTISAGLETGSPDFEPLTPFKVLPGLTVSVGVWYRARLSVQPGKLRGKVWLDGDAEPPEWQFVAFDDRYATGQVGVKTYVPPANTTPLPFVGEWGEFILHNPQRLTVVRSINGVVRAHPQGADVRLARPMFLGL